ncbi:MAG TPA: hypothetical protein VMV17_08750 [Streptosporangiaceae bacterium]|nr:hypothetical protein [Streptosporangiaceae bacterium]
MCSGFPLGLILLSGASSAPSCLGGIDYSVPPTYPAGSGQTWVATYTCMDGGTVRKPVPSESLARG